jgi:diguanylate cyclase (GGDEF)-like protein
MNGRADWTERERELLRELDEAATQRARAESQSLVLERITTGAPLREVLDLLVNTIEARSDGMLGSVLLLDPEGKRLTHGSAPSLPHSYTEALDGVEIGPSVGSCGTAAYEGRQVVVEDISSDPLWADYRDLAAEHGLAACWSTPIRSASGEVLGTFALYYHEPRGPKEEELVLIDEAVHLASISIERGRLLARHAHDALHDPLTGLPNRALLEDRLEHALASARRTGEQIAVLFIDLDGFKVINDELGHESGDRALRAAGRRILGAVRPSDTVARWGGDEFVLVRENVTGEDDVRELVQRIHAALRQPAEGDQVDREFGASIGVARSGEANVTTSALLQEADRSMYRAKSGG